MSDLLELSERMTDYIPADPVMMERWIREAVQLLETMPDVLLEINERRYAAETNHLKVRNLAIARYMEDGATATLARAKAEVEAAEALEAWQVTKAEYHYAEGVMKALTTKIAAMQNINKSVTAHYQAYQ